MSRKEMGHPTPVKKKRKITFGRTGCRSIRWSRRGLDWYKFIPDSRLFLINS
jgi:hypothetical protein